MEIHEYIKGNKCRRQIRKQMETNMDIKLKKKYGNKCGHQIEKQIRKRMKTNETKYVNRKSMNRYKLDKFCSYAAPIFYSFYTHT